jgi:hypothetical protein
MVASKESYLAPCEADGTTMKMTHFVAAILVDLSCRHELSLFSGQKVSTSTRESTSAQFQHHHGAHLRNLEQKKYKQSENLVESYRRYNHPTTHLI